MLDWTAGYVADIGYTYGYYAELNPLRARLAFLENAAVFPEITTACELGFGQGLSANIHAAASPVTWYGTDFNPTQAGFAQELARVSGSGAKLYDESFADFAARRDLPDFDFIGLHGIWSWISDENRGVIVDFVRRHLKVGGILYISYNTQPGWASFAPLRHLLTEHADIIGAEGRGIVHRIDDALDFAERLIGTAPAYARANLHIAEKLRQLKAQNRHYLAHEYFNRDWHPMHVATLGKWLTPAKVSFACSAYFVDAIAPLNLTAEQQAFLRDIPDLMFRESVRDFMVNQRFRRDYWVKGPRRQPGPERVESLRSHKVVLTTARAEVALKVTGALGEASLTESIYAPILDFLADYRPRTIGQIEEHIKPRGVALPQLVQAMLALAGSGHLDAAQEESVIVRAKMQTDRLNAHLIQRARGSGDVNHLASPVTGGGIPVNRVEQLFLMALALGKNLPVELAKSAWTFLSAGSHKLIKEGRTLETAEENLAELQTLATVFVERRLAMLRALEVI